MIEVTLYSRAGCHLCDVVQKELAVLQEVIPHQVTVIDIDTNKALKKAYGERIPVVKVGPYQLSAPIDPVDLKITLGAVQQIQEQERSIDQAIANGRLQIPVVWTGADRFSYWLSKHYLALLNLIVLVYGGLPFLAPLLMASGAQAPANVIYRVYGFACHQLAFRSMFLFGEQAFYPRAAAGVEDLIPYEVATGLDSIDLWTARSFTGNEVIGYKVALCERDAAIYAAILAFGLLFALLRLIPFPGKKAGKIIPSIPWYIWVALALVPIGLDGVSQLVSQPPFNLLPYRESTPFLRTLTGGLFGFMTAWYGYPMVEESMVETRQYLESKLSRFKEQTSFPRRGSSA